MSTSRVIDADGHVEPYVTCDWRKYAPKPFASAMDAYARQVFGREGDRSATRRGSWDPQARLEDMDIEGIDLAVLFGGATGGLSTMAAGDTPGMGAAIAQGYNNWLHDYCSHNPDRLRGAALVTLDDLDAACAEARRAVTELGAVGLVAQPFLAIKNTYVTLDNTYWDPLYETAQSLDIPILIHVGAAVRQWTSQVYNTHFHKHSVDFPMSIQLAIQDTVTGAVFERFPRLRIAFLEGSAGWLPWFLDRLDEHFEKLPHHVPRIKEKPSVLIARYMREGRFFLSPEPEERYLPFVVRELGDDFLVYASDYPHWDCEYPDSVTAISKRRGLSQGSKGRILGENAKRLYGRHLAGNGAPRAEGGRKQA